MATYAIGDVQGCYQSLTALLETINFDPDKDHLWFTGDLVNRGPRSLEVLEFVMNLGDKATTILGNHDIYLLALYYRAWPMQPATTLQSVLASPKIEQLIDWLQQCPLVHIDEKKGYAMIHAGLYPAWSLAQAKQLSDEVQQTTRDKDKITDFLNMLYGNNPNKWNDRLTDGKRARFIVNAMTRMRYVTDDIKLNLHHKEPLGEAPETLIPWFNHPQLTLPEGIKLLFGHWASVQGNTGLEDIISLDTGCAWGERLTAMQLDNGKKYDVPFQD